MIDRGPKDSSEIKQPATITTGSATAAARTGELDRAVVLMKGIPSGKLSYIAVAAGCGVHLSHGSIQSG
jgi:hypothetical protein